MKMKTKTEQKRSDSKNCGKKQPVIVKPCAKALPDKINPVHCLARS